MSTVGTVLDGAAPSRFPFKVAKGVDLPLHEYVTVDVGGKRVLAEVVTVGARNPLLREQVAETGVGGLDKFGFEVALGEVLGYMENGKVMRPKYAPKPNAPVYLAEDAVLQEFYRGEPEKLPIKIGSLIHREDVSVSAHLQDMQFHLGIFAQTRGGKSYLAGLLMEEILVNTNFPVIVIDVHGDYVMMDRLGDCKRKHNLFNVVVYYPRKAPRIKGVTADERELKITPKQMTHEAFLELLGGLGELQFIRLRNIKKELEESGKPFGLEDIKSRIRKGLESEQSTEEKRRLASILARLEDLDEDVELPADGITVQDLLRPKALSVICLRGLTSRVQDAYTSIVLDLIFRNHVKNSGDVKKAPPVFVFIEEAHRVASEKGGKYAWKVLSTVIREGAKFGLFLCLISQRPRSINQDVMANIGNYAVLRITNAQDQAMIESASESFSHRLVEDLPALNQGEAVLVGPFVPLPAVVKVSGRRTVHYGATPNLAAINDRITQVVQEAEDERW